MPQKSVQLVWNKEKDTAQIVCINPDFELTKARGSPNEFDGEEKRLQNELAEVTNESKMRLQEYVKSSQHKGYKTWDAFRAANPTIKPIKP
jgi:hypothetical protein